MGFEKILLALTYLVIVDALVIKNIDEIDINEDIKSDLTNISNKEIENPVNVFNGVYTDCFLAMSFLCLQKKTLLYLKELNKLNEVSVVGDYLKFVKLNTSDNPTEEELITGESSEELSNKIDKAVDNFFDNHLIRFSALGKDFVVPRKVEEFVGRKRRKGGGGGGGGHGGGDGGKKKMMMMAMMCMKMKLMMMVPAMMGMMGVMSFKGMMFSMMSFMISKMMLLMKILEKKGGGGGGGGGGYGGYGGYGGDGGWAAGGGGGGGGGAWMPAGQDYGGGGGYDANGQWQSRSIIEDNKDVQYTNKGTPILSYVKPIVRFNNKANDVKPLTLLKNINDELVKVDHKTTMKSRKKRGIIDVLQNAYAYWTNKVLGTGHKKYFYPKYKIIHGVKYVYSPVRNVPKMKTPKELKPNVVKETEETVPIITIDNYNKGEIIEGVAESRMNRRKFHKIKENVNETMDENPWE